jgi:hypothetical protein
MIDEQTVERESRSLMTTRRPIKFTPERLQQIKNLLERGKCRDEIAEILGVTVGSLQVTCSRLGISLRRPKIDNGVCLRQQHTLPCEDAGHRPSDHDKRRAMQASEEQSQTNVQSDRVNPARVEKKVKTPEAYSASVAIRFRYKGMEQTAELPVTLDTIAHLALEAALRNMKIGELIAGLIAAIVNKDRFTVLLDNGANRCDAAIGQFEIETAIPSSSNLDH